MKKSLTLLLAIMMMLTTFVFTAHAEGEVNPIVFNFVEADGSVPYGQGRNGNCYFPKGSSTINPEVYTWSNSTKLSAEGGFAVMNASGTGMLELDTLPAGKEWKKDKSLSFVVLNIKTEKAASGTVITFVAQGGSHKKSFPVDFTGEWQQIILDLNDASGWYLKDGTATNFSPMNKDGQQVISGGFRLDLPGSVMGKTTIDYVGLFANAEQAKSYKGRQESKSSTAVDGKVETVEDSEEKAEGVEQKSVDIGNSIIFSFIEEDGKIPNGKGRNGDCFFPQGTSTINPEIYTWNKGMFIAEAGGYAGFYPGGDLGMMEIDSLPKEKSWTADKKLTYLVFMIKSSSPAEATLNIRALGGKFKKDFKVNFTSKWQKIVLDLNDPTGWTMKNAEGAYEDVNYSPMNKDGQQVMTGGVRIDFPGNTTINNYTIDYFGIFGSLDAAKAHIVREKAETISVITGKVEKAPVVEEEPKEEEVVKPQMKDALTRNAEGVDNSITLVSAVPTSVISESAIIYKFAKLSEYDEGAKKWNILEDDATSYIQTWGMGTFEATTAGILKYTSNASGGTLFEVHPKKSVSAATHNYMVVGYKTNDDFSAQGKTGYLYSSGNEFRLTLDINMDSEWHYGLFDLKTLDTRVKEGNYANKATDTSKLSLNAFRIDFPKAPGVVFYIDYVGFFTTEEEAKAYIAKSEKAAEEDKNAVVSDEDKFTYMKGYEDGTFRPGAQMTRAEACTVIARLLADEEVIAADRETAFTDVKKGDWYYSYVTYLEELGYLPNYSGEFKPNQNITRGEFIKLTFEAGGLEFSMKRPNFTDLDSKHPYYQEIVFASGTGIVNGYDNGDGTMSFKPDGEITRAEIATVVNRILKIEATPDAAAEFSDLAKEHWAFGTIMAIASAK